MKSITYIAALLAFVFVAWPTNAQWYQKGLSGERVTALAIKSNGHIFAGTYSDGLFRSTDNGDSWTLVLGSSLYGVYEVFSIAFDTGGTIYAGTYGAGLFRSTNDGGSWASLSSDYGSNNLPVDDIYAVGITSPGKILAIDGSGSVGNVYSSTDNGSTWTEIVYSTCSCLATGVSNAAYIGGGSEWFEYTSDGGNHWTWEGSASGLTSEPYCLAWTPADRIFTGTSGGGVFMSSNDGVSWSKVSSGLTTNYINCLAIKHDSCIFAGTDGSGVFYSKNNGGSWTKYDSNLTQTKILSLACDNAGNLYAGTYSGGVWKKNLTDIGLPVELTSFIASAKDLTITLAWRTATEVDDFGFEIERKNVGDMTGNGKNETWSKIGFVAGSGTCNDPHNYSYLDANLSAGTYAYRLKQIDHSGMFKYSGEVTVIISPPTDFALHQNFPNPFNPSTEIEFTIAQQQHVSLRVYNVMGQEIETLVDGQLPQGRYKKVFDASRLSSGTYFYKLEAGSFAQIKRMMLVK
ncbi:MAG TPA: T9SS type A sorting domain-containing protein [Bacteroidota bacterium]|nr:T9SS type A sorting domain-containing protein [Bacteroidota bacterium]